jgi:hypothetical protein
MGAFLLTTAQGSSEGPPQGGRQGIDCNLSLRCKPAAQKDAGAGNPELA